MSPVIQICKDFLPEDISIRCRNSMRDHSLKNKKSFTLNCGYGKGYSVLQIANKFKKIKKNTQINFINKRPGDIAEVYSDTKKFKKLLRWKPKYNDIKKIIKSAISWEVKLKKLQIKI